MGGKRAYAGRLGKGRSHRHCCHSIASAKTGFTPASQGGGRGSERIKRADETGVRRGFFVHTIDDEFHFHALGSYHLSHAFTSLAPCLLERNLPLFLDVMMGLGAQFHPALWVGAAEEIRTPATPLVAL